MINLLPQEQQKVLQKEYHFRRAAVAMYFVNAILLIAVILLIPSYVLVTYRAEATIPIQNSNEQAKRTALATEVANDNIILTALTPPAASIPPSSSIFLIMGDVPAGDSVTSIDYEPGSAAPFSITVGGIAASRESLLSFVEALRREPTIDSVNLPISNFASDADIHFSFIVTGKNI